MEPPSPRRQRRTAKLRELVSAHEAGATGLATDIGTPKSHISAILAGRRGIGDALAAKIEHVYRKPTGWMDADDELVLNEAERALVLAFRAQLAQPVHSPTPHSPARSAEPQNRRTAEPQVSKVAWTKNKAAREAIKGQWDEWEREHRDDPPKRRATDH